MAHQEAKIFRSWNIKKEFDLTHQDMIAFQGMANQERQHLKVWHNRKEFDEAQQEKVRFATSGKKSFQGMANLVGKVILVIKYLRGIVKLRFVCGLVGCGRQGSSIIC